MSYTVSEDWIIGVFGVLVMAFFIGCTNCCQNKSSDPPGRRQPPSPPTPGLENRYEHSVCPPTPLSGPATQHSGHKKPRAEGDEDSEESSEEDFEEVHNLSAAQKSHVNGQNSATSRESAAESNTRQDTYANLDVAQDYANLGDATLDGPVRRTEHVYLKIIACDPDLDATSANEDKEEYKTPRSAINSIGKYSSHSDSLCHSYENVAVGYSSIGSDFEYENMASPLPV